MRATIEILSDIEDGKKPEYEELYMACLVQKTLMFFARNNLARLLKGGIGAELTAKEFPDAYADLGISKHEWNALRMDPYEYLGEDNIPGTPAWEKWHKLGERLLEKVINKDGG